MYNEDVREGNQRLSAELLHSVADIKGGGSIATAIDAAFCDDELKTALRDTL